MTANNDFYLSKTPVAIKFILTFMMMILKAKNFLIGMLLAVSLTSCIGQDKDEFPLFRQKKTAESGPVCLLMVAKYHKKKTDLQTLIKLTKMTDEDGTSLLAVSEAAEKIGLKNIGAKVPYKQVLEEAPLPAIFHWNNNHFVVVYNMTAEKVWVADPALGKKIYSKEEFCKHWLKSDFGDPNKGVVLLLEPK